ncbi:PucR family transcriptional regulator [Streptomyces alfalfae]|uniref:Helix-turn-helix domain-containing protein n=1 Tax=Streptomyces alfalfae TaxID=1642299 RepID=A0A7T4PCC3_9ACTN|nr:helix-turn-helix domain-containing protein [Streptomyces alfalfae]QQC87656.1 helix-turn-helix domain-containing protein [Streptomyces alfalfae]
MTTQAVPGRLLDGYADILTEATATGRRLTREELTSRRALGAQAAEAGLAWRALVREHLTATRAHGRATRDPEHLLATAAQAIDAFAEGYERAQRMVVRQEGHARRVFIDDLLHGRAGAGDLAARAERFGLRLSHAHAVAVTEGPAPYDDTDAVPRSLEDELLGRFGDRDILLGTKDGRLVCVAPAHQDDVLAHFAKLSHAATDGGRVALGRPRPGPTGIAHSYEEALNTLELAARMGFDEPVLHAADLLVFPVLTRDRQALVDLVLNTLGPLEQSRGGAGPLIATLQAYFATGCVTAQAARRLSLSIRALSYRLDRVHTLTGSDPADPRDRYTLQTAVIGARLLGWPDTAL